MDPRQPSEFIAIWTLGSISKLMFAGVRSASLFETLGRRGIMQSESLLPGYGIFTEQALKRYPVYFILRELLKFKEAAFRPMGDLGNRYLGSFLIENKHEKELWIWNLSENTIRPPEVIFLEFKTIQVLNMSSGKRIVVNNSYSIGGYALMPFKNKF